MKLYTTKEFAELSGVSIRTLKYWRKSGKLIPAVNNGKGKTFYSREQIFMAQKILGANFLKLGANVQNFAKSWVQISDNLNENDAVTRFDEVIILDKNGKKLQIYPARELVIATDKMKKNIFNPTKRSVNRRIVEDKKSATKTNLQIIFSTEFKDANSITAYDELVFDICLSEQFKGNEFTTPAIIHRAMGGSKTKIYPAEKEKILRSVRKLATTYIDFDITDTCKKFGYNNGEGYKYSGYLLPAEYITKTINGQVDTAVIHFLRKSPLLDVATIKNQLITCDVALLDVPNIRNTDLILALKGYLLRRILQIKGSHKPHKKHFCGRKKGGGVLTRQANELQNIILLETLFEQCGLSDADRGKKRDARNAIEKILNHFQDENLILNWEFEKQSGKFRAIRIEF